MERKECVRNLKNFHFFPTVSRAFFLLLDFGRNPGQMGWLFLGIVGGEARNTNYIFWSDGVWVILKHSSVVSLHGSGLPWISELCEDIVVVLLPLLSEAGCIRHTAGCCHGRSLVHTYHWRVTDRRLGVDCLWCALQLPVSVRSLRCPQPDSFSSHSSRSPLFAPSYS